MAFMHAVLAITDAGRRGHPAGAVLLQSRDGDRDGRLPRRARCRPTSAISCDLDAIARARSRRARAPSSPSRRTTRAARCFREAALRAVNDALPRARPVPHQRRGLRVLHLRRRAPRLAGRRSRTPPRTPSRCTRCRRPTASPAGASATWCIPEHLASAMMKSPGHDPDLPAGRVAGRGARRARGRAAATASRTSASSPRSATSSLSELRRSRRWRPCRPPTARSTACCGRDRRSIRCASPSG